MEEAVSSKIKMENPQARKACLKFGTEFGTIASGVNDTQMGMEASGMGEAAQGEQVCAGGRDDLGEEAVGWVLSWVCS